MKGGSYNAATYFAGGGLRFIPTAKPPRDR